MFCGLPSSQVKPSWGLRGCTRTCTNCSMTSLSWRRSLFLWAHCRGCTRYPTLRFALPAVAKQSPRESRHHAGYIMQQRHAWVFSVQLCLRVEPVTSLSVAFVRTLSGFSLKWDTLTFKLASLPPKISFSITEFFIYEPPPCRYRLEYQICVCIIYEIFFSL